MAALAVVSTKEAFSNYFGADRVCFTLKSVVGWPSFAIKASPGSFIRCTNVELLSRGALG
jgi:hypothetical protein